MIGKKNGGPAATEASLRTLRTLLREGDPAGDGASLAPERAREMRRLVLGSLAEPRRPRLLLAAASMATAALALALGLALHHEVPPPAPRPVPPPVPAAAVPLPAPPAPAAVAPAAAAPRPIAAAERRPPAPRRSRPPARPAEAADPALPAPLQIQFNTPGGTRVIWVLEPANPSVTPAIQEE
jgi:hypothetical protein